MGNSVIGNIIYFWIFVIGGMFIARLTGLTQSDKDTIIFIIILSLFYWGFAFLRHARKSRRGEK